MLFEQMGYTNISRNISGLGIELYVVKVIAESHGGTISVDSEMGKGTSFKLTFPL